MTGVQTQLRKHVALEHELSGNEQQVMAVIVVFNVQPKFKFPR